MAPIAPPIACARAPQRQSDRSRNILQVAALAPEKGRSSEASPEKPTFRPDEDSDP